MPQLFAHDGDAQSRPDILARESFDEELSDEIADHLAASASDLVRSGQSMNQAELLALARFGDVGRVRRKCWWIHNGERVMYRTAAIAVLVLLTIGMAVVGFGGWQLQRNLASRTEELSEQLATLSATQKALLDQQRPPEISGVAYLGDPSRPAKDVEIQVYKFSEEPPTLAAPKPAGVVVRRLRTDAFGRFDSGNVQPGEYCLLGPLLDLNGNASDAEFLFRQNQSRPLYLTVGVGKISVDMDLAASAQIGLEASGIPRSVKIEGDEVEIFVSVALYPDGVRSYPQGPESPSAAPPRDGWPMPLPPSEYNIASAMLKPVDTPKSWMIPPRAYSFAVQLDFRYSGQVGIPQQFASRVIPHEIKLTPGDCAVLSVSMPGDPIQARADAALKAIPNDEPRDLGGVVKARRVARVLTALAKEIELKVDVALQRN